MERGFYEFFAGGGMARAGLGPGWRCLFANDFDARKAEAYARNWGPEALRVCDVAALAPADLPGRADLAWASFPCQDLSLAGAGAGLKGARSGSFWPFWRLMRGLSAEGRGPRLIALENVCGLLTSHQGRDFAALCAAFAEGGWRYGALVIDAARFLPQSRPRLFIICVPRGEALPAHLVQPGPEGPWRAKAVEAAHAALPPALRAHWIWWRLPPHERGALSLADILEADPPAALWRDAEEAERLIGMMNATHRAKLDEASRAGGRMVGALYRRTRKDETGAKVQRVEARFDGLAGCLRTPSGGSSRQLLILVEGPSRRIRLISARETARLMGLPEGYILPERYNRAYHLTGDGVAAPVARFLAENLFEPLLTAKPPLS